MVATPVRIAVSGTHSTGKTTLIDHLTMQLRGDGLTIARTPGSLANRAAAMRFPKMHNQTTVTTSWLIGAGICAEAEACIEAPDVVIVDRSCLDPLAYFAAAQRRRGVGVDKVDWDRLAGVSLSHAAGYDLLIATELDHNVPLADGRDPDLDYRAAVDVELQILVENIPHVVVSHDDASRATALAAIRTAVANRQQGAA